MIIALGGRSKKLESSRFGSNQLLSHNAIVEECVRASTAAAEAKFLELKSKYRMSTHGIHVASLVWTKKRKGDSVVSDMM